VTIVLYGAGGATIVDVEESCRRLGLEIAAIVRNIDTPDRALSLARVVDVDALDPATRALPFLVPIFTPGHRFVARRDAMARGFATPATVVDPTAIVAASARIGGGSYVNAGVVIAGAASIGTWVFVNRAASLGHHTELADFASVGPGAVICGETRLGRGATVGAGAVVLPGVEIGANSTIAAGSVVRSSIPGHCLAAGLPARIVRRGYPGFGDLSVGQDVGG